MKCYCSFVYASNSGKERRILWKNLIASNRIVNNKPWCLLDDFNVTLKLEEHTAGGSNISEDMQEFIDCINETEVEDINSLGLFFTWIKSPLKTSNSIMKKLDRIMYEKEEVKGHHMYEVVQKMKRLKYHMKSLAWKNGNLEDRVEKCRESLKFAQSLMEKNPYDNVLKAEEAKCLSQYMEAIDDAENLLMHQAKVDWISKGDRNNKFFHNILKSRGNMHKITNICNEKGDSFEGNEVAEQFVCHFMKFLGAGKEATKLDDTNLFNKMVSNEEANFMIREVTDKEIRESMFDIGENKALGPDGYTAAFFKGAWDIVGNDICLVVKDFFKNGKLLGEVNATVITLIPKIQHPCKVSDFRPIACCNVLYKCISKILTNRIKSTLDKVVNINQSAFIPGRVIQDNLMITQELLKGYNCKNGPSRCALKIDIAKAYDTVNWVFLEKILIKFGFHKKMVDWHFMEVFSLILARNVERNRFFIYHKGCKELKLTHLSFADDLLVISHGDEHSIKVIKDSLEEFSLVSGLLPNMDKSVIFFGSVKENVKEKILEVLPFKIGKLHVKYLGIPLLAKRLGINDCKCLVEKVKNKVQDWKNKVLSYAGRLQLIASILSTMQSYWASVVKIPKAVTKEINGILKKFLWSYSGMSNGKAKVAWKVVCKPKSEGGLGIRNLEEWNDEDKNDSCTWKALLDLRNKVRNFFIHTVGNVLKDVHVPVIRENVVDKVKWRCNDGKLVDFSTKNAWWDLSEHNSKVPWWKVVWFSQCNPRSAFIKWLAANERLSTQDRIMKWSSCVLICPLCNKVNDSHDHLFFNCDFSTSIWDKLKIKMNMGNIPNDWRGLVDKVTECPCNNAIRSVLRRIILATAVYYIWKERNSRLFTNVKTQVMNVFQRIIECIRLQLQSLKVKKSIQVGKVAKEWNVMI
ncbi:RNA-directed DNA polymerase, eukaryota, reverse transcriptase zinc-binding domain protein [Tanacetum coccineum]